jgi:hypothetical protein
VGPPAVSRRPARTRPGSPKPAFYARTGNWSGDIIAVLHPPYTAWHLSYVVLGAALAPQLDLTRLVATLAAFFLGTGIAAHALDEWHSRPLGTALSNRVLLALGLVGLGCASGIAVAGAWVISPWVLAWAAIGVFLAAGYALEWHRLLHVDLTFGLAWGGFPVLVGYWAQTEGIGLAALVVALSATLLSLAQRSLSKPSRHVRRNAQEASVHLALANADEHWPEERLLATWERPLKLLAAAAVVLGLLLA